MPRLLSKTVTAVCLITLFLLTIVWLPKWLFLVLVQITGLVAVLELYKLFAVSNRGLALTLAGALSLSFLGTSERLVQAILCLNLIVYSCWLVTHKQPEPPRASDLLGAVFGWCYVIWLLGHATWLWLLPSGRTFVLYLFVFTTARNVAAGLLGPSIGGTSISWANQRKTVAGALAGGIVAFGVCFVLRASAFAEIGFFDFVVLALLMAVLGQLGDLAESMIKRMGGAVDSSDLLPGQGGVLDTIDSFLFTAPAVFYYVRIVQ